MGWGDGHGGIKDNHWEQVYQSIIAGRVSDTAECLIQRAL